MNESIHSLLYQLDKNPTFTSQHWQDWHITPILGGENNLLYRATRGEDDYAIKFTVRDSRNRAGREYAALRALEEAGLDIAPRAVMFNPDQFRQPVVVQTWLAGETLPGPPETDDGWRALLDHFCAIHSVIPSQTTIKIELATINCISGAAGKRMVAEHLDRLPPEGRSPRMLALLARFEAWTPPEWDPAPISLCHVDPNWRNFIRRPSHQPGATHLAHGNTPAQNFGASSQVTLKCVAPCIASVDWENSGWGDPAFEIADLMTHPAYEAIPPARWDWVIEQYADQRARTAQDTTAVIRIRTYYKVMLMWWVIRWARYLYEVPRGLDERLVVRPENWLEETEQKAERFMSRVEETWEGL